MNQRDLEGIAIEVGEKKTDFKEDAGFQHPENKARDKMENKWRTALL